MVGAAMRKEKVTPSGMPLSTKPMNSGTAEHEQNGVTMPSMAASTLPTPSRLPPSQARVCSALKKVRSDGDQEDHAAQQQDDLRHVVQEEGQRLSEAGLDG